MDSRRRNKRLYQVPSRKSPQQDYFDQPTAFLLHFELMVAYWPQYCQEMVGSGFSCQISLPPHGNLNVKTAATISSPSTRVGKSAAAGRSMFLAPPDAAPVSSK